MVSIKNTYNVELVFIEPKSCGVFDLEFAHYTGIMLFVTCPTSSMYVSESIVFGMLLWLYSSLTVLAVRIMLDLQSVLRGCCPVLTLHWTIC